MQAITTDNLYAVTVWYNPTAEHAAAIRSYIEHVQQLVIIDNSSSNHADYAAEYGDKAIYIANRQNTGIATALNTGCRTAISKGAQWILTMDQDSRFGEGDFQRYIDLCNAYEDFKQTGLFSPHQVYDRQPKDNLPVYQEQQLVMASGNIVNATAYTATGGFPDNFFIDLVDEAFCCELQRKGYAIVMVNAVLLHHRLGNGFTLNRLFGKRILDHSPLRHYYIVRNTLAIQQMYPEHKAHYRRHLRKRIKRLLLYDNHRKWGKIVMAWRGWQDFHHGIFGAYEDRHN